MSKLKELCNHFLNQRELKRTKSRVLAGNRPCITSVNFTLIVLNRNCYAFLAKDAPVLLDEVFLSRLLGKGKVRKRKLIKFGPVQNGVEHFTKVWLKINWFMEPSSNRHKTESLTALK